MLCWPLPGPRQSHRRQQRNHVTSTCFPFFLASSASYKESVNSFIFSFKNKDNLPPFQMKVLDIDHAIYDNSGHGPTFGSGHDIYIADGAGGNRNSNTNSGYSYIPPLGYQYSSSSLKSLLAGTFNFQPDDLEVFYQRSS